MDGRAATDLGCVASACDAADGIAYGGELQAVCPYLEWRNKTLVLPSHSPSFSEYKN